MGNVVRRVFAFRLGHLALGEVCAYISSLPQIVNNSILLTANRAHPVRPLIGQFRPLQGAFATPVRGSRHAGSKTLTYIVLLVIVPGRSWGEIENSPCYPVFAGVGARYRRSTFRSSRITRVYVEPNLWVHHRLG